MIEAACACGVSFELPESQVGSAVQCGGCGRTVHFVCAEALSDGAGAGDFDAVLTVETGPAGVATQFFLGGVADIEIGKLPERHIQLAGPRVSRLHCRLVRLDFGPSRWRIVDNASTNGLSVNGQAVAEEELESGDRIGIGDYELSFQSADELAVAARPFQTDQAEPVPLPSAGFVSPASSVQSAPAARRALPAGHASSSALLAGSPKAEYLYWLLLVFMLPLVYHTFQTEEDVSARFERTVAHASAEVSLEVRYLKTALREKFGIEGSMPSGFVVALMDQKEFAGQLPGGRLDGALLPRSTWTHWLFALLSAGAFFALIVWMFPLGAVTRSKMLLVGLFTGTLGIILLLGFQLVANWTQGVWIRGHGIITLLFYLVKFIGFSYRSALDPENGFLLSFMGFTFGVGVCEELCKVLPLFAFFNSRSTPSWRGACMWALASGVGFGVSEGITYSSDFYNGIDSGAIYLVRFASCVALHAIWAAAAGIALYRYRNKIEGAEHFLMRLGTIVAIIIVPILLHGLYDTLLKKQMGELALVAALASFGWLVFQVERMRTQENAAAAPAFA